MVAAPISHIQALRSQEAERVVVVITLRRAALPEGIDEVTVHRALGMIPSCTGFFQL